MCLAIPAQIKFINGNLADVDIMGIERTVDIQLIENPKAEDYILVHAGYGIQKIHSDYFNYLQDVFEKALNNEGMYE